MAEDFCTREKIIGKAIEIFSIKGYEATTLSEISNSLGITRSPIYYHFKDKYGLYLVVFNKWVNEFVCEHDRILSQDKHIITLLKEAIYCCVETYKRFKPCFFFGIETAGELSEISEQYIRITLDAYESKLNAVLRAKEKGEIRDDISPDLIVKIVYVIFDGIKVGIERSTSPLNDTEIQEILDIQISALERFCCKHGASI